MILAILVSTGFLFRCSELHGLNSAKRTVESASMAVQKRTFSWDSAAPVFVTVGQDHFPGVADVDDNGNGVVDDLMELGATGSDDAVLTPADSGYEDAATGNVTAMILSHGAMRLIKGDQVIKGPIQVRIDLIGETNQ